MCVYEDIYIYTANPQNHKTSDNECLAQDPTAR
jgi:hypothetical protein